MRLVLGRSLLLAALLLCGGAGAQNSLRIAAVVNDDIISAYDLNARLSL
ncbi:MAG: peptidyl-prolyl cis-trans isomerase, partial [Proteobacteria bacterium]|nr:peptidyl-prolyl cis-trans isomerase [Pseudomonadota bacterium]